MRAMPAWEKWEGGGMRWNARRRRAAGPAGGGPPSARPAAQTLIIETCKNKTHQNKFPIFIVTDTPASVYSVLEYTS